MQQLTLLFLLTIISRNLCGLTPKPIEEIKFSILPTPQYSNLKKLSDHISHVCIQAGDSNFQILTDRFIPVIFKDLNLVVTDSKTYCNWQIRFVENIPKKYLEELEVVNQEKANEEEYFLNTIVDEAITKTIIYARSEIAAKHALFTLQGLIKTDIPNKIQIRLGTIFDYPSIKHRGVIEGFYGSPYSIEHRSKTIQLASRLKQNTYIYRPHYDEYVSKKWDITYPKNQENIITNAVEIANSNLIDFIWAINPGQPVVEYLSETSIEYSSEEDFSRLINKIESVRKLGVQRFGIFLDDLRGDLVHLNDQRKFKTLANAHVHLVNKLDEYLRSKDSTHKLIFIGSEYSSQFPNWRTYNTEVGINLNDGIEVLWTGTGTFSEKIIPSDLQEINSLYDRKMSIWDNGHVTPFFTEPVTGRSPKLPGVIEGYYFNAAINEQFIWGSKPLLEFHKVLGPAADYSWNTMKYNAKKSFQRWLKILEKI